MKTALQIFIEDVEEIMMVKGQLWWHERKQKALKKEKEDIIEAHYHNRCLDKQTMECTMGAIREAEEYYKQRYEGGAK